MVVLVYYLYNILSRYTIYSTYSTIPAIKDASKLQDKQQVITNSHAWSTKNTTRSLPISLFDFLKSCF